LLSIQCSVFGEPHLVDPGTYCYTAHPNWRDYFRSTAAHSTVLVDRQSQAMPRGPFSWHRRPRARLRQWVSTPAYDLADAEHDAYGGLRDPVIHRRRIYFEKPRYWVLVDDIKGLDVHEVELRFQFGRGQIALSPDGWASSFGSDGRGLMLKPFSTVPLQASICEGGVDPIQGWISPDYGLRQPAPVLGYSSVCKLPMRVVTLLLPVDGSPTPPEITTLFLDDTLSLYFAAAGECIKVDTHKIAVEAC
jgi:hypothetical protein